MAGIGEKGGKRKRAGVERMVEVEVEMERRSERHGTAEGVERYEGYQGEGGNLQARIPTTVVESPPHAFDLLAVLRRGESVLSVRSVL